MSERNELTPTSWIYGASGYGEGGCADFLRRDTVKSRSGKWIQDFLELTPRDPDETSADQHCPDMPPKAHRRIPQEASRRSRIYINDLYWEHRLFLRSPIQIIIDEYPNPKTGTEFVASWPETESWSSASTKEEAIEGLQAEIGLLYTTLRSTPNYKLGKLPLQWKRTLMKAVERYVRTRTKKEPK